jgi:hypothetical protein
MLRHDMGTAVCRYRCIAVAHVQGGLGMGQGHVSTAPRPVAGERRPARGRGEGGSAQCVVARMPAPAPRKRLSDQGRLHVLQLLADDLESGRGMSVRIFQAEYCAVARHAEIWAKNMRREYGKLAERPAFSRVEQYLRSGCARIDILRCMKSGTPLEGKSKEQPGIEQCRALVAELEHLRKTSTRPSESPAPGPDPDPNGFGTPPRRADLSSEMGPGPVEPGSHQDLTRISPGSHQDLTRISPGSHQDLTRISPGSRQDLARISPGFRQDLTRISPGSRQDLTRISPGSHQDLTRISRHGGRI